MRVLLASLKGASVPSGSLLIISSDAYTEEIVNLVKGITFIETLHIFYPASSSFFPDTFPGPTPTDCYEGIRYGLNV